MKRLAFLLILLTAGLAWAQTSSPAPDDRGRYLLLVGGCNDCHTPGYAEKNGAVPESDWMTGSNVGYRGPWGVAYPGNLRLMVQKMPEEKWMHMMKEGHGPPPMPWTAVHAYTEADAHAVYQYLKALGPAGQPAPKNLKPGQNPTTPTIDLTVKQP